ncbi:MAG: class I SAM-dependent methyltransferase [Verrucomicrobiota bacterium]
MSSAPLSPSDVLTPNPTATESAANRPDPVRDLYRRYPYPSVEATEAAGTNFAVLGALDYVRHVFWPGRRSLAGLRVLDAGCGTGITAVQIARDYPQVDVTAIDVSDTSLAIARRLAAREGVRDNLTFRVARIEDLADERGYDYIVSSGVLHHLADPVVGARRLGALLSPTGGMAVMLYATHGRAAIYMMQDLLRRLGGGAPLPEQVEMARAVLGALPACHPFASSGVPDHKWDGDAGLVDLLLHPRDRSYTVADVFALVGASGLRFDRFLGESRYRPETYLTDEASRRRLAALPDAERYTVAELLHGAMSKHTFFATRAGHVPLRIPARGLALLAQRGLRSPLMAWPRDLAGSSDARGPDRGAVVVQDLPLDPLVRSFELDGWSLDVVAAFDGERTGSQVFDLPHVQAALPGDTRDAKRNALVGFLEELAAQEILLFEP